MKQLKTIVVHMDRADIQRGTLALVNREHPIGCACAESALVSLAPGIRLEKPAALLYEAVLREMGGEAHIMPVSGYRSTAEQARILADTRAERGDAYARTYVALPGCSEHHTGLALDVGKRTAHMDFVAPAFPYEGICQRFRETAVHYGFIQRYPAGKEHITGIGHEPWHFRFVGIPHAALITSGGLTLEEYTQWVKAYPWEENPLHCTAQGHRFSVGYVPAGPHATEIALPGEPYTISGNNVDGFVVTLWGDAA